MVDAISRLHEATETPTFYIVEYTFGSNTKRSLTSNTSHPTLKLCKRMEMDEGLETHQHSTKLVNSIYLGIHQVGTSTFHVLEYTSDSRYKKQQSQSLLTPLSNFVNTLKMDEGLESHAPIDPVVLR